MPSFYDPSVIEPKWQKKWDEAHVYHVDLKGGKKPHYCLVMFPYPSGARLHVGHWFQYGPTDSYARFLKMRGEDVFFPMGFDAFGLPAENYAIKTGVPPAASTAENVKNMIEQFRRMGCMYDWSKSLNTSDSSYYRWTQWLFLQMFEHGLAYKKEAPVNFCPQCQTVLAREQCQDGTCERCETQVVQRPLTQWFWKLTQYAERLLSGLDDLDWPEKTKLMQRNWIGKSQGAEIHFEVERQEDHAPWENPEKPPVITVFTTRPDTLFGATYLVLAPEHPLIEKITTRAQRKHTEAYVKEVKTKNELQRTDLNEEKTGVFTGSYALHPVTGERIPIWIADYVLMTYGTGAVMAVPAHDERDCAFAEKYGLPACIVVKPAYARYIVIEKSLPPKRVRELKDFGTVTIQKEASNWGKFFMVDVEQRREQEFIAFLEEQLLTSSDDGGAWYADSLGNTNMVVYPKRNFHLINEASIQEACAYGLSLGIP
ncbi:class I tRNA ligase family protein, partial [Candidatus Peregrinibacteria bacterium]|nr:class I tRNA ligase family protein [Candidatus Peregrinibacteria bacterium]